MYSNNGTPEGFVTANTGSLCIDTSTGSLYVKTGGLSNTNWSATSGSGSGSGYESASLTSGVIVTMDSNNFQFNQNGAGRLQIYNSTSSTSLIEMKDNGNAFGIYSYSGDPNGIIIGVGTGSLCIDTSTGGLYIYNGSWSSLAGGGGGSGYSSASLSTNVTVTMGSNDFKFNQNGTGKFQIYNSTSEASLIEMNDGSNTFGIYSYNGDPSMGAFGTVGTGSLCIDTSTGGLYIYNGAWSSLSGGGGSGYSSASLATNVNVTMGSNDFKFNQNGTGKFQIYNSTSEASLIEMNDGSNTFGIYSYSGDPSMGVFGIVGRGSLCIDTSTGGLYIYNGAEWSSLAGGGGGSGYSSASLSTNVFVTMGSNNFQFNQTGTGKFQLNTAAHGKSFVEMSDGSNTFGLYSYSGDPNMGPVIAGRGSLCVDTMSGFLFISDGTAWTQFADVSSMRYKKDVTDYKDKNDSNFDLIRPRSFKWKDRADQFLQIGMIAEELQEIYPEFIQYSDPEHKTIRSIFYQHMIVLVIEKVQMLRAQREMDLARISELEERQAFDSLKIKELSEQLQSQEARLRHLEQLLESR